MWLQVLRYLGSNDLESFGLTCHKFFAMYDRFLNDKEIIFYGNINTNEKIISLADKERTTWNLKFVDVHLLDDSILSFFHSRGSNVHSLVFQDCKVLYPDYCEALSCVVKICAPFTWRLTAVCKPRRIWNLFIKISKHFGKMGLSASMFQVLHWSSEQTCTWRMKVFQTFLLFSRISRNWIFLATS